MYTPDLLSMNCGEAETRSIKRQLLLRSFLLMARKILTSLSDTLDTKYLVHPSAYLSEHAFSLDRLPCQVVPDIHNTVA